MLARIACWLIVVLAAVGVPSARAAQGGQCPPAGWNKAKLENLKAAKFEISDKGERERFAQDVVACLASPDPFLRDVVAFEALSHMLRADQLSPEVQVRIARDLLARLGAQDALGFERPFVALVLAEIVRADGIAAFLPQELRDTIAGAAVAFMRGVDDYRGFDEREGWRHGVAHGADLLMQLARNPKVTSVNQLTSIRDAVGAQLAPAGHFYIYGEPERLMQPIIMLAQRRSFDEGVWTAWFDNVTAAAPLRTWDEAFQSQAGLAKRHNIRAFLYAVWLNARLSENMDDDRLLAGTEAALRRIP